MTSKPYPDGVTKVIGLLSDISDLEKEIIDLRPKAERLHDCEKAYANKQEALAKLLNDMDISALQKGNFGWQHRLSWFLQEMQRQVR